jgi:hypothetical protein
VPPISLAFSTSIVHLSIMSFFNKSEQINNQFGHKITKLRRKKYFHDQIKKIIMWIVKGKQWRGEQYFPHSF